MNHPIPLRFCNFNAPPALPGMFSISKQGRHTMEYQLEEITGYISHWKEQEDSEQKEVVLKYWLNQALRFAKYSRTLESGASIPNSYPEAMLAIKTIARCLGVPAKKKDETRHSQLYRICKLVELGWKYQTLNAA